MVTVPQGIQNPAYRRSRPTFCIPKTASSGRQVAVAASDLAAARRIGGVDTTSRGNSKSLANLLCAYAVPDDERARIVRPRFQIPVTLTNLYYLNWPRKA